MLHVRLPLITWTPKFIHLYYYTIHIAEETEQEIPSLQNQVTETECLPMMIWATKRTKQTSRKNPVPKNRHWNVEFDSGTETTSVFFFKQDLERNTKWNGEEEILQWKDVDVAVFWAQGSYGTERDRMRTEGGVGVSSFLPIAIAARRSKKNSASLHHLIDLYTYYYRTIKYLQFAV